MLADAGTGDLSPSVGLFLFLVWRREDTRMAIGPMDKPTGPTGILTSNRPTPKAGGTKTMGGTKGIVSTPFKKAPAMRGGSMRKR